MPDTAPNRPGRKALKIKSIPVKIAVTPALHANLVRLVGFGWGNDVADVMRTIVIGEVRRLQDANRLPDEALDSGAAAPR